MKRIISVLCILALTLTSFAACSTADDTDADDTTAAPATTAAEIESETEPVYTLGVPDELDYNGYTFRFLTNPGWNGTDAVQFTQFMYDEENGDIFNDILYRRNDYTQEYLNIEFETQTHGGLTDVTAFRKAVNADDDSFDLGIWIDRFALTLAQEGLVYSFNDLSSDSYIDTSNPWWLDDLNQALTIDHKLFFAAGAYDMSIYGNIPMLLFNKDMAANLQLDDMYDMVRNGSWTVDVMYDYMKRATADTNGNSEQDAEDRWGAVYIGNFWNYSMSSGNDEYLIKKDENDLPYFAAPGNERLASICEAVANMMSDPDYAIYVNDISSRYQLGHVYENVVTMFASGNALFAGAGTFYLNNLRDMKDEFGILPFPRIEKVEAGTPYTSWLCGVFGYIPPVNHDDPELISAVLETLAYSSYHMVVPDYLNTVLQLKQARDDDSAEMLDMMSKHFRIDLAHTYFLDMGISNIHSIFTDGEAKYASTVEKYQKQIEKALEKVIDAFQELN